MSAQTTRQRVIAIVCENLNVDEPTLVASNTFAELGADSLGLVEVVMSLEEEFAIEIPDDEAAALDSLNKVVQYVESKIGN